MNLAIMLWAFGGLGVGTRWTMLMSTLLMGQLMWLPMCASSSPRSSVGLLGTPRISTLFRREYCSSWATCRVRCVLFISNSWLLCFSFVLSVLHLNSRGLRSHFDDLVCLLSTLKHDFHFIALSETWLSNNTDNNFNIPGYHTTYGHRQQTRNNVSV